MTLRVATFNLNNLFSRWSFSGELPGTKGLPGEAPAVADRDWLAPPAEATLEPVQQRGGPEVTLRDHSPMVVTIDGQPVTVMVRMFRGKVVLGKEPWARTWLAHRMAAIDADVWALQEVEDQSSLEDFVATELAAVGQRFSAVTCIEGNDERDIEVAVLSRVPVDRVVSWRYASHPDQPGRPVFSRDLLQVDLADHTGRRRATVLVNHLKSQLVAFEPNMTPEKERQAKADADLRRRRQAETVVRIARRLRLDRRTVIAGDMNDAPTSAPLAAFGKGGFVDALTTPVVTVGPGRDGGTAAHPASFADAPDATWTHRYAGAKPVRYERYDQLWTSPDLAGGAGGIQRRTLKGGDATDHDPAWVDLDV
jgi:endonuclease/exonuclease/phosphatase family metal-dependent hydrolase